MQVCRVRSRESPFLSWEEIQFLVPQLLLEPGQDFEQVDMEIPGMCRGLVHCIFVSAAFRNPLVVTDVNHAPADHTHLQRDKKSRMSNGRFYSAHSVESLHRPGRHPPPQCLRWPSKVPLPYTGCIMRLLPSSGTSSSPVVFCLPIPPSCTIPLDLPTEMFLCLAFP